MFVFIFALFSGIFNCSSWLPSKFDEKLSHGKCGPSSMETNQEKTQALKDEHEVSETQ